MGGLIVDSQRSKFHVVDPNNEERSPARMEIQYLWMRNKFAWPKFEGIEFLVCTPYPRISTTKKYQTHTLVHYH